MFRKKDYAQNNNGNMGNNENEDISKKETVENTNENEEVSPEAATEVSEETEEKIPGFESVVAELESSLAKINDKYLRLSAEFDNYRKRTLREKMEMTRTASESVMFSILPVIDDFERAMKSMEQGLDFEATKEGIILIFNKFKDFTAQNGIKEIDAVGQVFDTDLHEAVTKIPAPSEDFKGKILDVIQKGYYLNDKVIRFAKVVVGE